MKYTNKTKDGYDIIAKYPAADYVLIDRHCKTCRYVAAWCYDELDGVWGQGHYFNNKEDAVEYCNMKVSNALGL